MLRKQTTTGRIVQLAALAAALWTALVSVSALRQASSIRLETREDALAEVRAVYQKDVLYREWNASHGGVYVPVDEKTPPNPYLSHVPERDITTPSGRRLTLVNPAYMTRQVYEEAKNYDGPQGHITSLRPIRPQNGPDPWEREALAAFEGGAKEVSAIEDVDGRPHVRYTRPFITEARCLKCHGAQGYKAGDVRGGVSVSIPIKPYADIEKMHLKDMLALHAGVWLLGMTMIGAGGRRIYRDARALLDREEKLFEANLNIEAAFKGLEAEAEDLSRAEERLRRSENSLQEAQRIAQLGSWELDLKTGALAWSDVVYRIFEIDPKRFGASYEAFLGVVHPDDRDRVDKAYAGSVRRGEPYEITHRLLMKGGRIKYVDERCETYYDAGGRPLRSAGTVQDITERRIAELGVEKLNRVYSVLRSANQLIVRAADRRSLFDGICRIAVEKGLFRMAWVGLVDEESGEVRPAASAGCDEGYLKAIRIDLGDGPQGMGPTGRAVATGEHFINNDTAKNPVMLPWRDEALKQGYLSSAAFPLTVEGRTVGAFSVYSGEAGFFSGEEVGLLDELAGDVSFALKSLGQEEKRVRAEAAILKAKGEWERTFDSINDPIMLLDTGYRMTRVNKAMAEKLGVTPREAVGLTCYEAVHGLDAPYPGCPHKALLADGKPHAAEVCEERLGGYFLVADSPLFDAEGRLTGSVHYARDITARKRAEEKLRLANLVVENSPAMIFRWKAEEGWPVEYVSSNVAQLGYAPDELLSGGVRYADIIHPEDLGRVAGEVAGYAASAAERFTQEYRVINRDGEVRWLDDRTVVERDPSGRATHFQGIVLDITERKRAEEAVKAERERFNDVLETLPVYVGILTSDYHVSFANRVFRERFGVADGRRCFEFIFGRTEPCETCETFKALETMSSHQWDWTGPDGRSYDVFDFPFTDTDGSICILEMGIDVTERTLAEAALNSEAAVTGALLEAARVSGGNLDWDEVAGSMARLLLRFTGGNGVFIFTLARDGMLIPRKAAGLPEEDLAPFYSLRVMATEIELFRKTLSAKKTLRFDSDSLPMYMDAAYAGPLRLKEAVVTPIPVRDGVAGFILINYDSLPEDPRVAEIIEGIARQLGVAHDNSRLYAETQNKGIELARSIETLKVLSEIDKKILSTLDRDEMLKGAVSQIRRVAPADVTGVFLAEEDAGVLRFAYGWSLGMSIGDTVPFGQCSGYRTLKTGKTLVRMNLAEEADLSAIDSVLMEGGIKSDIFVPIVSKGKGVGILHVGSYRVAGFSLEDVETAENLARQMGIALENARLLSDLEDMFINVVTALASAIDAKSPWTKGHSERVTSYALMTAELLGLAQKEKDDLRLGGLLHDIGKIGTYDEILNKPGRLTEEEFALIRKHPAAGAGILGPIKQFKGIIPVIMHHHERWDGGGYPAGLKGEEIPLLARILCVADSFDSMTADRPYRPSPGLEYAIGEITRCAGSQFDPVVAEAFVGMLKGMP